MLLPIGDDNRDRKIFPIVNYLLIAINILAFIFWQKWGLDDNVTLSFATIPAEILTGKDIVAASQEIPNPITGHEIVQPPIGTTPYSVYITLITSMFMHGGLAHLGGNMLYLFIFGDNIEDALGHFRYLVFYLLCGILASLCHVFSTFILGQNLLIPSLGASGAISGVLGAYIMLHPGRSVHLWIILTVISVPAFIAVGLWFVFQVVNGLGALGGEEAGGIAYAAHIGGFIAGFVLVRMFAGKYLEARKRIRQRTGWLP
jgi:membrane associated rhomboid family serine protease